MALDTPIATVVAVTGRAYVRDAEGQVRPLVAGEVLHEGDVVLTEAGARVELATLKVPLLALASLRRSR